MSKIICDICGTAYPETSERCPICGTTRPDNADVVYDRSADDSGIPVSYQYVKGGRFSKANVRKRNSAMPVEEAPAPVPEEEPEETSNNKGLVITAIILLLAIIAVAAYVAMRIWLPNTTIGGAPTEPATTAAAVIACDNITITSENPITLEQPDAQWQVVAELEPYNTTQQVVYQSSDESVCTVSDSGKLTAVGAGQATITVRCGDAVATCSVICTAQTATEATETAETVASDIPADTSNFKISKSDFTLTSPGKTWTIVGTLAGAKVAGDKITWRSSDTTVATVDAGKVTAVAPGTVRIYAKYGDNEQSCIVRCVWKSSAATAGTVTEEGASADGTYKLNKTDITLAAGKTYQLQLSDGTTVQEAKFTSDNTAACTVSNSGKVTAVAKGTAHVTATYENKQYTCIVRVS